MVARKKKRTIKTGKRSLVGASLEVRPAPVRAELSSRGVYKPAFAHTRHSDSEETKNRRPHLRVALLDPRADLSPSPSATGHH